MLRTHRLTTFVMLALLLCCTLSSGCRAVRLFGPNFSLSLIIPLGLNGNPGILNPFGLVQGVVNNLLGVSGTSGGSATPGGTDGGGTNGGSIIPILN